MLKSRFERRRATESWAGFEKRITATATEPPVTAGNVNTLDWCLQPWTTRICTRSRGISTDGRGGLDQVKSGGHCSSNSKCLVCAAQPDRKIFAGLTSIARSSPTVPPKQVSILATLTFCDIYFNVDRTRRSIAARPRSNVLAV